jgi:hypothetical protein
MSSNPDETKTYSLMNDQTGECIATIDETGFDLWLAAQDLLDALIDRVGDLPPIHDGKCSVCGREYFGDDIPADGMCPADDCPDTIARGAIAKAKGGAA